MTRTVSASGWMLYPQADGSQLPGQATKAPAQSSSQPGMLQEYGSIAKHALAPSSTGIAEGYNKVYDLATGFKDVPGTNLATGTSSSGTFGGSNITNAAYGYAGGKLANELFDNKGYSDIGGSIGASIGGAAAVGGSAAGTAMGAQFGMMAGPIGALAGAVLGAAIGSLFGSGGEDYRFRTYSGELGENSQLNTDQLTEKQSDWESINRGGGLGRYQVEGGENMTGAYDRWVGSGDYSKNTSSAYKWLKEGNTFSIGDKYSGPEGDYSEAIRKDWASVDTAFGKYTVGHIDDIPGRTKFATGWVDAIGKLDAAVASVLTPEQIAASKTGLSGSIQGTPDWHNKSGQNYATDAMVFDRYTAIFELAGRDDLAERYIEAMDRSISGQAENEGETAMAIDELTKILKSETAAGANKAASSVQADRSGTQPAINTRPKASTPSSKRPRRVAINRPQGVINPAMEASYV